MTADEHLGPGSGDAARRSSRRPPGPRGSTASGPSTTTATALAAERAELARRRAHPLELLRACSPTPSATPPGRPCASSCWSRPTPKDRESIALAPPPVAVVVDEHDLDPMHGRRPPAPADDDEADAHLGLGHAQRPLHLRPVRHRRVEPLRPRRRALGRREPGPLLQPAVHLRPGRPGQDPPAPRHRPPRAHRVPQQAGALRLHRVVHERVRRRHPGQGDARASSGATATSTCC